MPADPTTAAILVPLLILMMGEMAVGILILARYRREPSAPALSGYLLLNPIPILLAAGFGFYEALGHEGQLANQVGGFLVALTLMAFAASFLVWFAILYVDGRISEVRTALVFAPAVGIGLAHLFAGAAARNDINNVAQPILFSGIAFYIVALVVGTFLLRSKISAAGRPEKRPHPRFLYRFFFLPMTIASLVAGWIVVADSNEPVLGEGILGGFFLVTANLGIAIFVAVPPLVLGLGLLRGKIFRDEVPGNLRTDSSLQALDP